MNQACVCDPGFSGIDCSERECPRGDDPLTKERAFCGERPCHNSVQQFDLTSDSASILRFEFKDWKGRSQAVSVPVSTAEDAPGLITEANSRTRIPGSLTTAGKIMYTIRAAFPEEYLNQVEVRAAGKLVGSTYTADQINNGGTNRYFITFTGAPGRQDLIKLSGLAAVANSVSYVEAMESGTGYATATTPGAAGNFFLYGNNEELPCSGRGSCNKGSGLCECFAGYYGAACDYQNVLVM